MVAFDCGALSEESQVGEKSLEWPRASAGAVRCAMADLRPVSDRAKPSEWKSFPRRTQCPRYRQRGLVTWRPKLIEATAFLRDVSLSPDKAARLIRRHCREPCRFSD